MSDAFVLRHAGHSDAGDPSREIRLGTIIAVAFFVVFLGWAAFVPLDAGVHAAARSPLPATARASSIATAASSRRSTSAKASMFARAMC